jgi:hypothetical protein
MRLPFHRLSPDRQECTDQDYNWDQDAPLYVLRHSVTGATAILYQSNGIILKTSLPECQDYLENEVRVYQHLMKTSASKYIPILYGYFGYRNTKVIIMSDEGSVPLRDVTEVSHELK